MVANGAHQLGRIKARVGPKQQGGCGLATDARSRQLGRQGQHALDVVFGLTGRVLCARAQGQLQAKALRAQVGRQWTVAVDPRIRATHMLFGGATVVHGEGVDVQRHIAAGQHTEVHRLAADFHAQHGGVDVIDQVKPRGRVRVHALAQGGRRWHGPQTQCAGEEGVFALAFDGIEVVLAQTQQAEVALEDVAVGHPRAHGEGRVHHGVEVDALQILPNQCQAGLVAQVVGQLFDYKVGHVVVTCWVKTT